MTLALARFAAVLLALAFAWSALAKTLSWQSWRTTLAGYGFGPAERTVAVLAPAVEAAVVLLLVITAELGAAMALALLAAFCLAILRARSLQGDRLPCGCFGGARSRDFRLMLLRNWVLMLLCAVVLVSGLKGNVVAGGPPEDFETLPAALIVVGAGLGAWMLKHARILFAKKGSG